jgi:hypothetical protein
VLLVLVELVDWVVDTLEDWLDRGKKFSITVWNKLLELELDPLAARAGLLGVLPVVDPASE